jgi:hypothetical protein
MNSASATNSTVTVKTTTVTKIVTTENASSTAKPTKRTNVKPAYTAKATHCPKPPAAIKPTHVPKPPPAMKAVGHPPAMKAVKHRPKPKAAAAPPVSGTTVKARTVATTVRKVTSTKTEVWNDGVSNKTVVILTTPCKLLILGLQPKKCHTFFLSPDVL